jgi:hypothetical protein
MGNYAHQTFFRLTGTSFFIGVLRVNGYVADPSHVTVFQIESFDAPFSLYYEDFFLIEKGESHGLVQAAGIGKHRRGEAVFFRLEGVVGDRLVGLTGKEAYAQKGIKVGPKTRRWTEENRLLHDRW